MGVVANVGFAVFPDQGDWLGKRCRVVFGYDTRNQLLGTFVRSDNEKPWVRIIRLDDGRHLLDTECQHSGPEDLPSPAGAAP